MWGIGRKGRERDLGYRELWKRDICGGERWGYGGRYVEYGEEREVG